MRFEPERPCGWGRVDSRAAPPLSFIAIAVDFAVVSSAQRHSEFVADLAAKRGMLSKAQMVGV